MKRRTFREVKWLAVVTQGSVTTCQPARMAREECQPSTDLTRRWREYSVIWRLFTNPETNIYKWSQFTEQSQLHRGSNTLKVLFSSQLLPNGPCPVPPPWWATGQSTFWAACMTSWSLWVMKNSLFYKTPISFMIQTLPFPTTRQSWDLKKPEVGGHGPPWMSPAPSSASFMHLVGPEDTGGGQGPLSYLAVAEFSLLVVTASQGNTNLVSDPSHRSCPALGSTVSVEVLWRSLLGRDVPTAQSLMWEMWL